MKTLNRTYSEYLARTVRSKPRECWRNSFTAVACMDEPWAVYVEGWLVVEPGIVIEHGWIEIGEQIIDPTIWSDQSVLAESYFPGVRYDRETVEKIIRKSGQGLDLPIVWGSGKGAKGYRFGWGGSEHTGYCRARDEAYKSIGFDAPGSAPFYGQMVQRLSTHERKVTSNGAASA